MMEEYNHDVKGSRLDDESEGDFDEETSTPTSSPSDTTREEQSESARDRSEETAIITSLPMQSNVASGTQQSSTPTPDASGTGDCGSTLPGFSPNHLSSHKSLEEIMLPLLHNKTRSCCANDHPSGTEVFLRETAGGVRKSTESSRSTEHITLSTSSTSTPSVTAIKSVDGSVPAQEVGPAPNAPSVSPIAQNVNGSVSTAISQGSTNATKVQSSHTQPPVASPTTQESFFKSVHKRLQFLEANSTLSLQYIEEQSRILRDAFSKVEKRQLAKTTAFLETLNTTVLTELREFRMQYDQFWQSTAFELSSQREQSQREVLALSARLSLLADQILFQQRVAIAQSILILLCLGLVIFSRHGTTLELPARLQNAINRSSANLSRHASTLESPPGSPSYTRPFVKNGLFRSWTHTRNPSEESDMNPTTKGPAIEYSPPTPESQRSDNSREASPGYQASGNSSDSFPEGEFHRRVVSSPMALDGKQGAG